MITEENTDPRLVRDRGHEKRMPIYMVRTSASNIRAHLFFFFLNDPAPPEISPLPLPAPLPFWAGPATAPSDSRIQWRPTPQAWIGATLALCERTPPVSAARIAATLGAHHFKRRVIRSEEHTSELQSPCNLVCRLLLEKKKDKLE